MWRPPFAAHILPLALQDRKVSQPPYKEMRGSISQADFHHFSAKEHAMAAFFRFFRNQVRRQGKRRPKPDAKCRYQYARLGLEALEERTLLSVNASLAQGVLSIVADQTGGTSQVQVLQADSQVQVGDTAQPVGSFAIDQIQSIDFQYGQRAIHVAVAQAQMTLTGFSLAEADFTLGDDALTADAHLHLPNGTAVEVAGQVRSDSTFDLT